MNKRFKNFRILEILNAYFTTKQSLWNLEVDYNDHKNHSGKYGALDKERSLNNLDNFVRVCKETKMDMNITTVNTVVSQVSKINPELKQNINNIEHSLFAFNNFVLHVVSLQGLSTNLRLVK